MFAVLVEFRILPEKVAAFEAEISENARASRESEPGCRQFDVCRDPAEPSLFVLYELYDDEAAFEAHLRSAHFLEMNARTQSWVREKSVRRLVRTSP